jgi:hypothetical protein
VQTLDHHFQLVMLLQEEEEEVGAKLKLVEVGVETTFVAAVAFAIASAVRLFFRSF